MSHNQQSTSGGENSGDDPPVSTTAVVSTATATSVTTTTSQSPTVPQPLGSGGVAKTEVTSSHPFQQVMASQWQPHVLPSGYYSGQAQYVMPPAMMPSMQGWHQPSYVLPPMISPPGFQQPQYVRLPYQQGVSAPGAGQQQPLGGSQSSGEGLPAAQPTGASTSGLVAPAQRMVPLSQRLGPRMGPLPAPPPEDIGRRAMRPAPYETGNEEGTDEVQLPPGLSAFMAATSDEKYFQSVNYSKAAPQVKPFNGSSPLREFVELIDNLKINYQLDNRAAGSLARASLEGEARRYISGLMPYEFPNQHLWRDQPASGTPGSPDYVPAIEGSLTSALWRRFGERISPAETRRVFNQNIPQRPRESFAAYVDRLKLSCRRYVEATYGEHGSNLAARDPTVYATMFNSEMINGLWAGMLSPYRDHLEERRYSFVWFDQITESACEFELTDKGHRLLHFAGSRSSGQGRSNTQGRAAEVDGAQVEEAQAQGSSQRHRRGRRNRRASNTGGGVQGNTGGASANPGGTSPPGGAPAIPGGPPKQRSHEHPGPYVVNDRGSLVAPFVG